MLETYIALLGFLLAVSLAANLGQYFRRRDNNIEIQILKAVIEENEHDLAQVFRQTRTNPGAAARVVEGDDAWLAPLLAARTQPNVTKKV
jgi:hypothetical protein